MADPLLKVRILTDVAGLQRGMRDAEQTVSGAAVRMRRLGDGMASIGKKMTLGATLPIVAFGASSFKVFTDIDKGLRNVNSLFGLTGTAGEKNFEKLKAGVAGLSKEIGVAQSTIADGLYNAISAGVPQENAFTFMKVASKTAIAGVTDTNTAVEGLTKIINAFGLSFNDAEMVADSMFTTVNKGIVTFEEMSRFIFQIAPTAKAAGISLKEMNAGITTMTLSGVPMATSTDRMRAAITSIIRPSEKMDKLFGKLGFKSAEAAIRQRGLKFAVDAVTKASKGSQSAMIDLLGSQEAVQAVQILGADSGKKFAQAIQEQGEAAGASQKAFEEQEKSVSRRLEKLKTKFDNLRADIGEALLPIAEDVGRIIGKAIDWFNKLPQGAKDAAKAIAIAFAVGGPVMFVLSKVASTASGIWTVLSKIGKWTVGGGSGKGGVGGVGGALGGCCCCGAGGVGGAAGKGKGGKGIVGRALDWGPKVAGLTVGKAAAIVLPLYFAFGGADSKTKLTPEQARQNVSSFISSLAKDVVSGNTKADFQKIGALLSEAMRGKGLSSSDISFMRANMLKAIQIVSTEGTRALNNQSFWQVLKTLPEELRTKIVLDLQGKAAIEQWLARLRAGVNVPITPQARSRQRAQTTARKGGKQEFHAGGFITGGGVRRMHEGGLAADEVPAVLQTGEFVVQRRAVQKVGVGFLSRLNRMHKGGTVASPTASGGGGVTINVSQLVVREEADIERIARALHERWRRMTNRGAA